LGLGFGHLLGIVTQVGQLGAESLHGREVGVGIAFLGNQLASDFGRTEASIQAVRAELGISLTLTINKGWFDETDIKVR